MSDQIDGIPADSRCIDSLPPVATGNPQSEQSLVTAAFIAYGLMAWGMVYLLQLFFLPDLVVLLAIPAFIAGGVVAHVKRDASRPFWMANHYRYMVRTFWFTLLWNVLTFSFQLPFVGFSTSAIASIWGAYRVIRGMILLRDWRAIPDYSA